MKKFNLFAVMFLATAMFLSCGKQDEQQQTAGDNKTDAGSQNQQQAPQNQNQSPGSQTSGANELGIKEGMPADYPSDIPQPANSKCLGSLNTSEGTVVTFESTDKPKDILTPFAEAVEKAGFKKGEGEMMSDDGGMTLWTKDKREVSIMLAWDKDKKVSSVVVTYK
ncbi:MAG: hypothetical protein L0Y79_03660 [Chlorobi bacterium]|nr:hypothetical protein [Chlorobiota bacterium]MCI0717365.1 hypothetical protein [Chlorobiota bacterium]